MDHGDPFSAFRRIAAWNLVDLMSDTTRHASQRSMEVPGVLTTPARALAHYSLLFQGWSRLYLYLQPNWSGLTISNLRALAPRLGSTSISGIVVERLS